MCFSYSFLVSTLFDLIQSLSSAMVNLESSALDLHESIDLGLSLRLRSVLGLGDLLSLLASWSLSLASWASSFLMALAADIFGVEMVFLCSVCLVKFPSGRPLGSFRFVFIFLVGAGLGVPAGVPRVSGLVLGVPAGVPRVSGLVLDGHFGYLVFQGSVRKTASLALHGPVAARLVS